VARGGWSAAAAFIVIVVFQTVSLSVDGGRADVTDIAMTSAAESGGKFDSMLLYVGTST
jgi:hypothetical protein